MKKCSRVKNPCKICLQTVTNKTGVQCKGACKKWAHFSCLNFTPGKIQDIKAGIITITCPCPNCNTEEPKEFVTNPPFTCNNQECPANKAPKCQQNECPTNAPAGFHAVPQATKIDQCGPACAAPESRHIPPAASPKLTNISPTGSLQPSPHTTPMRPFPPPLFSNTKEVPPCMPQPLVSCTPPRSPVRSPMPRSPQMSPSTLKTSRTPSQSNDCEGLRSASYQNKSASCSCLGGYGGLTRNSVDVGNQRSVDSADAKTVTLKAGDCKVTCSDSKILNPNAKSKDSQKHLLSTIHQLCSTVGQLSNQIKELMCKMMSSLDKDP